MKMNKVWGGTVVLFFATIILVVLLIAFGFLDPKPLGQLRWQKSVASLTIEAGAREVLWLAEGVDEVFTVRGTAVYQTGEQDINYGLIVGDVDEYVAVLVSPLGYVTVRHGETVLLPFQPWPHVRTGEKPNEIWVDVNGDWMTVWLNREVLWTGEIAVFGGLGVMGESWGETAVVQFSTIQLFQP